MTARAMGAATGPPVCSLAAGLALDHHGDGHGRLAAPGGPAKAIIHVWLLGGVGAQLGGAGLAADLQARGRAGSWPCRRSTTPIIAS